MSLDDILKASQRTDLSLQATRDGKMKITGFPSQPKSIDQQWQDLCAEYDAAKAAENDAFGPVNAAFRSVASGSKNRRNPTGAEFDALDTASAWRRAVLNKMRDFVKKNT